MRTRQHIPEDLAQRAPGPELAVVLAGIDSSRLVGFDAVQVMRAQYRQVAHEQARFLEMMVEVGRCDESDSLARCEPGAFASEEARAALVLTRRRADDEFWFGHDRLPAVHSAMLAGDCDRSRAWIFAEWTRDLAPEQARAIVARLLPRVVCGELTTGQLIEQLKKLAVAIDPEWARRRYERALGERKVVGSRNADGTANLGGYNLPVDRVAAAAEHIDALAKAAKRAGSGRRLDHLRAELFLGMTDGGYAGLDDDAVVTLLLATGGPSDDAAVASGRGPDSPADGASGRGRGVIELRARLSTLLARDQHPAEIAGWGPVHAELARDLTDQLARGQWRWVVTDDQGLLLDCGITRLRPTGEARNGLRTRDVVELQIPETLLHDLARAELGAWMPLIRDLAWQHATKGAAGERFARDARRRHPGAAQRRWLQMRDRHCVGRGCRAPARGNQQDHTIDHSHGGPTLDWNLGGLCGSDHALKTDGGWTLAQDEPGHFRWRSRLGHVYHVPPRPVIEPFPEPIPAAPDPYPLRLPPEGDWEQDKILEDPPPPEPQPPVARGDPDEPPPF